MRIRFYYNFFNSSTKVSEKYDKEVLLVYRSSRCLSISSCMSTHTGGRNFLLYSIVDSSLLDAFVVRGSRRPLSAFSYSTGELSPVY